MDSPFIKSPGFRLFLRFVLGLFLFWYYFLGIPGQGLEIPLIGPIKLHPFTWGSFFADCLGFGLVFVFGLAMLAAFVLPVQSAPERRQVFRGLLRYFVGQHGAVGFVKDGTLVGRRDEIGEKRRKYPGILLLDSSSAAVLQKSDGPPQPTPRPEGLLPHEKLLRLLFSEWWKQQEAALQGLPLRGKLLALLFGAGWDWHDAGKKTRATAAALPDASARAAGPGIVFTVSGEKVVDTLDLRRQVRTASVKALTRDGIEVEALIIVVFDLDPGQQKSERDAEEEEETPGIYGPKPAFPFNPESAFKAVYGAAVGEKKKVAWADLPTIVAAERFRDLLSIETIDGLFSPRDPETFPMLDFLRKFGDDVKSQAVFQERGIRVLAVVVPVFTLPEAVQAQRVQSWSVEWQRRAAEVTASGKAQRERIIARARARAYRQIVTDLGQTLAAQDAGVAKEVVAMRLYEALNRAASEPATRKALTREAISGLAALSKLVDVEAPDEESR